MCFFGAQFKNTNKCVFVCFIPEYRNNDYEEEYVHSFTRNFSLNISYYYVGIDHIMLGLSATIQNNLQELMEMEENTKVRTNIQINYLKVSEALEEFH